MGYIHDQSNYRPDIDGLRAIAILSVVCFHTFPELLPGGFVGVDVFFVISGFLISGVIFSSFEAGSFSFVEFYARRARRIFPALIVVLVSCLAFGWFALLPGEIKQLGKHTGAGAGFIQNFVLLSETGYFDTASEQKPLLHLWSLAIEEQFYLAFPILAWTLWKWRQASRLLPAIAAIALVSFSLNAIGVGIDAADVFFHPYPRAWELLSGAILARKTMLGEMRLSDSARDFMSAAGITAIALAVFMLNKHDAFPGWLALLPVVGSLLVIAAGPAAILNRTVLSNRAAIFIGLISYPLYLWHWPILSFSRIIESGEVSPAVTGLEAFLSVALAWATYRLIERPIRSSKPSKKMISVLCLSLIATGSMGYALSESDGTTPWNIRMIKTNARFAWGKNSSNAFCKQDYPAFSTGYCMASNNGAPNVMVIGDSHSNHLYPGIAEQDKDTGAVTNIARAGCPPLLGVASIQKGSRDECAEYAELAYRAVSMSSAKTIILAARWPLYLSGHGFGNGEEANHDRTIELVGRRDVSDRKDVFEIALRNSLNKLVDLNRHVVFVLDTPELGFDPKSCVERRPLRLSNKVRNPCAVSRRDYDDRRAEYVEIVRRVLAQFPSVSVFDPADVLCDDTLCWAMRDGKILYRDDDHLSIEGSRLVASGIHPMISARSQ